MIYLHKILSAFLSPVSIIIALLFLGLLFKRKFLIFLATCLLLLGSMPIFATYLVRFVEGNQIRLNVDSIKKVDAIVVLGGMLTSVHTDEGVAFEWLDPDRFFAGVDLALANKAPYLIFSGGKLPWEKTPITEGMFLQKQAIFFGIDKGRILITEPVHNTDEEAVAIKSLLSKKMGSGPKSIVLVTSAFHMQRAKALFIQNGFDVVIFPVDFKANLSELTPMSFLPSAYALKDIEFVLRELMGQLYYSTKRYFVEGLTD